MLVMAHVDVLAENNQKQMRELIDELEKAENEPGSVAQKGRRFI